MLLRRRTKWIIPSHYCQTKYIFKFHCWIIFILPWLWHFYHLFFVDCRKITTYKFFVFREKSNCEKNVTYNYYYFNYFLLSINYKVVSLPNKIHFSISSLISIIFILRWLWRFLLWWPEDDWWGILGGKSEDWFSLVVRFDGFFRKYPPFCNWITPSMDGVRRWPIRDPSECALLWVFSDSSSVVVVPF